MNIVITGGTSGIGKAIYDWAQNKGHSAISISRKNGYDLSETSFLPSRGITEAAEHIRQIYTDGFDVLINNAGVLFLDEGRHHCSYLAKLHLSATLWLSELLLDLLKERQGLIINIASVSGIKAEKDTPFYAATKAGVISITKSLALKYAPDVRVNCISPGFFNTNLVPGATPEELIKTIPLGREASATEIIPAVEFLIKSKYTTGANIVIDGGVSL